MPAPIWIVVATSAVLLLIYFVGWVFMKLWADFTDPIDQEVHLKVKEKNDDARLLDWLEEHGLAIEFSDKRGKVVRLRARKEIDQARFKDIREALRWAREQ